jgi:hypothetical protein
VVVGQSEFPGLGSDGFVWTPESGIQSLTEFAGTRFQSAYDASADGTKLLAVTTQNVLWSAAVGVLPLGDVGPGWTVPVAISGDGRTVLGRDQVLDGAVIWTERHGWRRVSQVLEARGVDMTELYLVYPTGISYDGRTIVGWGYETRGPGEDDFTWIAYLGDLECPADADGDLVIDLTDLAILLTNFGAAGGATREQGDLDADGDADLDDLTVLLINYGTICD